MPYSRQRKAAKQVMQNLADGTTPEGEGQVRKSAKKVLGQSSTHVRRQNRTATAQEMQRLAEQHTSELQERRECDGWKQRTHKPADSPSVWRGVQQRPWG